MAVLDNKRVFTLILTIATNVDNIRGINDCDVPEYLSEAFTYMTRGNIDNTKTPQTQSAIADTPPLSKRIVVWICPANVFGAIGQLLRNLLAVVK